MRRILIATHGKLAKGYQDTIEMICGVKENTRYMCFYSDGFDDETEIKQYMAAVQADDEVVIFTDMPTGSVNQNFFSYIANKNIHLTTGINLPLVLEIVTCKGKLTRKRIDGFISTGISELYYVDLEKLKEEAVGDENFFK
jgi:mannose/fructose-specific phosphotransferase system component IIA